MEERTRGGMVCLFGSVGTIARDLHIFISALLDANASSEEQGV